MATTDAMLRVWKQVSYPAPQIWWPPGPARGQWLTAAKVQAMAAGFMSSVSGCGIMARGQPLRVTVAKQR